MITRSVLDFGAKGDGVTDDTAAFKATIAAATSNLVSPFDGQKHPSPIFVPPGTYLLSEPIDVYDGFSMESTSSSPAYQDDQHCPILWNKTGPMFRIPPGKKTVLDLSWKNLYMSGDRSKYKVAPYPGDVWLAHDAGVQIRGLSIQGCRINAFNSLWGIPVSLGSSATSGRIGKVAGVHNGPPTIVMARIRDNMIGSLADWNDNSQTNAIYPGTYESYSTIYPGGIARCGAYFVGSDSWIEDNMFGGAGNGARHPQSNRNIFVVGLAMSVTRFVGNHIVALTASHTSIQGAETLQYRDNRHDPGFAGGSDSCNLEVYNSKNIIIDGNWFLNACNKSPDVSHRSQLVLVNVQNVQVGANNFHNLPDQIGIFHIEVISNKNLNYPTTTKKTAQVQIGGNSFTRSIGPTLMAPQIRLTAVNEGIFENVIT